MLQYALEFAHSRPEGVDVANVGSRGDNIDCLAHDVDMESPKSQARYVCNIYAVFVVVCFSRSQVLSQQPVEGRSICLV